MDDKLNSILKLLIQKIEELKKIGKKANMCLNVAHYVHVQYTWGWHLNKKHISTLYKTGLEIDIDLYASGNWLPD